MSVFELILIAISLAMDAFAIAICKGLSTKELKIKHYIIVGLWFGGFQALMPLIGYGLGSAFEQVITEVDHWFAFGLLSLLGINMIRESFSKNSEEIDCSFAFKTMFGLAVATSIDALAVGITFGLLPSVNIGLAILLIGVITFILSVIGVKIGNLFGSKLKSKAELIGGIILVLLGVKILLEHLGVISF